MNTETRKWCSCCVARYGICIFALIRSIIPYLMRLYPLFFLMLYAGLALTQPTIAEKTAGMTAYPGFFPFYWDEREGKIWLEINRWEEEILYVNALAAGLGSNDIGLDRNQLGQTRIVSFRRIGNKVLMIQPNYDYRALSENQDERRSVEDAFAKSSLWGFRVEAQEGSRVLVDMTAFLLRDAHGVVARLKSANQGTFRVDESRSAIYMEQTKNFPLNSEFESMVTFTGEGAGVWLRSVSPSQDAFTLRMHHSLIQLPDAEYKPRVYDPRSGYFGISYQDYATPIDQPLVKRFIARHRLEKKNPSAKISEPVEPIVYYVDRGAPEPIKSALIEGASWWNQAFEAAGYKNAFQVKEMPADADPLDVRYNVINWVHRSTRGWSYGSTVTDPRTGEIIKGHVLLGSLRVRQDFLIAQGLVEAYEKGTQPDPRLLEMSLARLRQLSAHEVGHTIGIMHNYTASINDRASVMDYPAPYITLDALGNMDFSQAYATGIGAWDKRAVIYGYQHFPEGTNEKQALQDILKETARMGLLYLSDQDARPQGSAHPQAHLWDNGASPAAELRRVLQVRKTALERFDARNIPTGTPMAELERVLVPLYLAHRYQVEATAKIIGGVHYTYAVKGDGSSGLSPVEDAQQRDALAALLLTLDPATLMIPDRILQLIPPQPPMYARDRELFKSSTGNVFDIVTAAQSAAGHTIDLILQPERLARMLMQRAQDPKRLSAHDLIDQVLSAVKVQKAQSMAEQELARALEKQVIQRLMQLAGDSGVPSQVAAIALFKLSEQEKRLVQEAGYATDVEQGAHYAWLLAQVKRFREHPGEVKLPAPPVMPDGAPIGCDH
jgi:hypothetical protein